MYFDRFDIVEAWYLALSHCHSGQSSDAYIRLCHVEKYFRPRPMLNLDTLSENGRVIYDNAIETLTANA